MHRFGWLCAGGPLGWLYPSEIQPLETRSAGQGIATLVNLLFSWVIGQTYLSMLCSLKVGLPCQHVCLPLHFIIAAVSAAVMVAALPCMAAWENRLLCNLL